MTNYLNSNEAILVFLVLGDETLLNQMFKIETLNYETKISLGKCIFGKMHSINIHKKDI